MGLVSLWEKLTTRHILHFQRQPCVAKISSDPKSTINQTLTSASTKKLLLSAPAVPAAEDPVQLERWPIYQPIESWVDVMKMCIYHLQIRFLYVFVALPLVFWGPNSKDETRPPKFLQYFGAHIVVHQPQVGDDEFSHVFSPVERLGAKHQGVVKLS